MKQFIEQLIAIKGLFDLGCEVGVDDDGGILITGYDFPPPELESDSSVGVHVERHYGASIEYDDNDQLIDTLTPLIEKIKSDNMRQKDLV